MAEIGDRPRFEEKDAARIDKLVEAGRKGNWVADAKKSLAEVIRSAVQTGMYPETVLVEGPAGKLTEPARKELAKGALGGEGGVPIRFHPEVMMVEGGKTLPPITLMVLAESSPTFAVMTAKMARTLAVLDFVGKMNQPEALAEIVPEATTPETIMFVELIEKGTRGVTEELMVVESGEDVHRSVLEKYISRVYKPLSRTGAADLDSSFEDAIFRFKQRVEKEAELGRLPVIILALESNHYLNLQEEEQSKRVIDVNLNTGWRENYLKEEE